jgi:hypothetical protein
LPLNPENDPDLEAILDAWLALSKAVRRSLASMARASVEATKQTK